ncbi:transglutaminase family protein [Microbacterium tumbae]
MSPADASSAAVRRDMASRREPVVGAAVLALLAGIVALWPYVPVIAAGPWTFVVMTAILGVAATGAVTRALLHRKRAGVRAVVALAVQIAVALFVLTAVLLPQTAVLGFIPTLSTLAVFGQYGVQAASEIYNGNAPIADTVALRAVLGAAFAVVAILIDQLVALRRPLLTAILVTVVGALPMIITLGDPDVVWFIALAIVVLVLLRRAARGDRRSPRRSSALTAVGTGAVAVLVAVIVAPALPVSANWLMTGAGVSIDATLRLGDDLRRPDPIQVMTLATTAETAPYLRIATLSRFNGDVWRPDRGDTAPLTEGFGDPDWSEDVEGTARSTSIRILGLSSSRLPLPYPAQRVVGLPGGWEAMPENRTLVSERADASGSDYTVTSALVQPTLEQITAARVSDAGRTPPLPDDLPPLIAQTAREVTADADTDYDRLIALQDWFRNQFEYSIDTPVDEGFDGTGADAVATFLEVRSGYCIHFAGAFALMAKTLDMPVRIVVGYLPGRLTDEKRGDEFVYSVMSDQLHAWPEVHFEGIGWVPFEPTATLGVATSFAPAETEGGAGADPDAPEAPSAAPTTAPTTAPTIAPEDRPGAEAGGTDTLRRLDPTPVMLIVLGVLLVLLLPALIRQGLRMLRMRRASGGDATAAWTELRDTMLDLGLSPSEADTPRVRAAELQSARRADPEALRVLVAAIEQVSYARSPQDAGDLATPLHTVLADLRAAVDPRSRFAARLLPRSLFAQRPSRRSALV